MPTDGTVLAAMVLAVVALARRGIFRLNTAQMGSAGHIISQLVMAKLPKRPDICLVATPRLRVSRIKTVRLSTAQLNTRQLKFAGASAARDSFARRADLAQALVETIGRVDLAAAAAPQPLPRQLRFAHHHLGMKT